MRRKAEHRTHENDELRLFFAFEIPPRIREQIAHKRQVLVRDFPKSRWVRPESQHLTVAFLGDTPSERVDEIVEAVSGPLQGFKTAEFTLDKAGFFPNEKHPRNAWIGGESSVGAQVAERLGEVLRNLNLKTQEKEWVVHLTQARFSKPWPRHIVQRFVEWAYDLGPIEFSLDEMRLFSSSLEPGGARYRSLARVSLR